MNKKELYEKLSKQLSEQLDGFVGMPNNKETIGKIFGAVESTLYENLIKDTNTVVRVKIRKCVYCKQGFTTKKEDEEKIVKIDGKPLCDSCERILSLEYFVSGIDEHSTFEDYVESQIVLENMALED